MADSQTKRGSKPKDTKSLTIVEAYGFIKKELDRERNEIWKQGYDRGFYDAKKLYYGT